MTASVDRPSGSVVLRLDSCGDGDVVALRQQLALCLASGIRRIHVDAGSLTALDLPVRHALQGVADYLRRKGGALTLAGAEALDPSDDSAPSRPLRG